jgi:hypothetical protein
MRAARVDANQAEIVEALRQVGATVQHLHGVGAGCPDLAVGLRGVTYLLEIKMPAGKLTADEREWHNAWKGHAVIVRSVADALAAVGAPEGGIE